MACSCSSCSRNTTNNKKEWSTAIGKKWEQHRCNSVRSKTQRTHTGCSHLSKGQWQAHVWLLMSSWWLTGERVWVGRGHREIAWMLATFYMSTWVVIPWVYVCAKLHQDASLRSVEFVLCEMNCDWFKPFTKISFKLPHLYSYCFVLLFSIYENPLYNSAVSPIIIPAVDWMCPPYPAIHMFKTAPHY